jgi:3-methyladenine DNA glycosylase AlkD
MKAATPTARDVSAALRRHRDKKKAAVLQRFFKTGPGEYAEGDRFLGVTVPKQRAVARQFAELRLVELRKLLRNGLHEERLTALLIMVRQYQCGGATDRERLYRTYLGHTQFINNWDLVDSSAVHIVGPHIAKAPRPLLRKLVRSSSVWERRIAALATFHFINNGDATESLWVARALLGDSHDLIHKATGWMLREVGKRVDEKALRRFLDRHAHAMPRTMLRYASERLPASVRKIYLQRPAP